MLCYGPILLILLSSPIHKTYHRDYFDNGNVRAQGWKLGNSKEDFWKYFHTNGKLMKQGHYKMNQKEGYWYFYDKEGKLVMQGHMSNGQKVDWWLFYDDNEKINHKCQLKDGVKNGYCLKYVDEKLKSAEKFQNGKKIKEWFSFASFKKENNLSDLK